MKKLKSDIIWSLKLYSLILVIPITLSIANILFVGIIGIDTQYGFLMNFKKIWIDFFFTGHFLSIAAWRIHIALLVSSFIVTKI